MADYSLSDHDRVVTLEARQVERDVVRTLLAADQARLQADLARWNADILARIIVLEVTSTERARMLELQADEYARRLDELNHAHAEAQRVLGTYVTREVYAADEEKRASRLDFIRSAVDALATRLNTVETARSTTSRVVYGFLALLTIAVSVIGLVLTLK